MSEATPRNTRIFKIEAHDPDPTARVVYELGNFKDTFYINGNNGEIRLRNNLDFEQLSIIPLRILAHDGNPNSVSVFF